MRRFTSLKLFPFQKVTYNHALLHMHVRGLHRMDHVLLWESERMDAVIHIDLSVEPHWKQNPPHVLFKKSFERWDEAIAFLEPIDLITYDGKKIADEFKELKATNEYCGIEYELMDMTGTTFIAAVLSVEGRETS